MTGTTVRIRWGDGGEYVGSTGTIGPFTFRIQRLFGQGLYLLTAELPGLGFLDARNEDRDELKAEAERWLEEFVSSLGAVFPAGECPECGFRPPTHTHDKDCSRYQTSAPRAGEKE